MRSLLSLGARRYSSGKNCTVVNRVVPLRPTKTPQSPVSCLMGSAASRPETYRVSYIQIYTKREYL